MNRNDFKSRLAEGLLILDGAMGTELAKRGMPGGVCPEQWVLEHPQSLIEVQQAYRQAGSQLLYTCTFGGNRIKLDEFGLGDQVVEINAALARLSRDAADNALVFGGLAPTGRFVEPFGDLAFEEAVDLFKEQVRGLLQGGVDGFVIETMMDIQEARAALLAVRESCDLPAMVSMTFGEDGLTLTGTDPLSALVTLQSLGADAVGCNCSTGPGSMVEHVKTMAVCARVPLFAKPNAGMPKLVDGETCFDMDAETFASHAEDLLAAGVNMLGGCCGTTPAYIEALCKATAQLEPALPSPRPVSILSSARTTVTMGPGQPLRLIGERINPTGKKKLQAELREGKLNMVRQYALEQRAAGADLLDVNMGMSGIDEKGLMTESIALLARSVETPLCIDTTDPEVMEAALRLYPGRALLNSISLEAERIEKALPIAAKYGAMFILLPLSDEELPKTCERRIAIAEKIFEHASAYGFERQDIVIDGLVMTVSSEAEAAQETLRFVDWASHTFGTNTTLGLSNVSFGLPERKWVNAAFLSMNMANGLSMAIANPASELVAAMRLAGDALMARDPKCKAYTRHFAEAPASTTAPVETLPPHQAAHAAVVQGDEDRVLQYVKQALEDGMTAQELVNRHLIPAIQEVGQRFDRKEYFLPQLMMSADAMKKACDFLAPQLATADGDTGPAPVVLLATVEGDIHDIGKNLVSLMLSNHGFEVMDLGKDVSADEIIRTAREKNASVIGLSALMTTTMTEMEKVIDLAKQSDLTMHIMVGGAVVDQTYADEIGADGYAADAVGAVRIADDLTSD